MRHWLSALPRRAFVILMLIGSGLITMASFVYFDLDRLPPFAIEKLPVRFETLWLTSLRIHVASALLALPLCLVLSTRTLQRRPAWHRRIGRVTGVLVLLALVPSGVVLSFDAKGGAIVTAGFLLSAAIVAGAMIHGVLSARRRDLLAHARAMRHVVAQMSVAVTSRTLIVALDAAGVDPDLSYVVALWGPVLFSAAIAELVGGHSLPSVKKPIHTLRRIFRDIAPLVPAVRLRSGLRPVPGPGR